MGTSTSPGSEPIAAPESEKRGLERLSALLNSKAVQRVIDGPADGAGLDVPTLKAIVGAAD